MMTIIALTMHSSYRYKFICFALPVIFDLSTQAVIYMAIPKHKELRAICMFNLSRIGSLIILLATFAGMRTFVSSTTTQQERTFSAAFLVVITTVPTAFIKRSAIVRLRSAFCISGVRQAATLKSESETNLTHTFTTAR